MRSRLLLLGLAATALMGMRVNAQSSTSSADPPVPAPTCAACGAPVIEETCTACVARPCDLFKGLRSLAACRGCAAPALPAPPCATCAPAIPECATCAPVLPVSPCATCAPAIPECTSCAAPIPDPTCPTCGAADPACPTCGQAPVCAPGPVVSLGAAACGTATVLRGSVCGVRSMVSGLFGALAEATAPCTACNICGQSACPACGQVTVVPEPSCPACTAKAAAAAGPVLNSDEAVNGEAEVAPTPATLPESPTFAE